MTEFTDEYFINLTMKYDERDDTIYPQWARWCYLSDDKYYIDGKDGYFFTHKRTEDEIVEEKAKKKLYEKVMKERMKIDREEVSSEDRELFDKYEEQFLNFHPELKVSEIQFVTFEEWKQQANSDTSMVL